MASLETTELKMRASPTGGVEAAQSPLARRFSSAGYKGFLQGSIGGGSLYGMFGLIAGSLAAIPFAIANPVLWGAVPYIIGATTGLGVLKGADVFGRISSNAAMLAEQAEVTEQRRSLLDRFYDLPKGKEGDNEARAITEELMRLSGEVSNPPSFFHWKPLIIGAVIGGLLALGVGALVSGGVISGAAVEALLGAKAGPFLVGLPAKIGVLGVTGIGTVVGALAGGTIGIDRYYIRKWFDHTQNVVHSSSHRESSLLERHQTIERIKEANRQDEKTRQQMALLDQMAPAVQESGPKAPEAKPVANLDKKPTPAISEARREGLLQIQRAMEVPAV